MPNECALGYIKAKFAIPEHTMAEEWRFNEFTHQFSSRRQTFNYVYISLGHSDIPDNDIGRELIREIEELRGKITRLDFAVDILQAFDIESYYKTMRRLFDSEDRTAPMGRPALLTSPDGTTVYIGKRSSARLLRVYDKRAEVNAKKHIDIGFELTRFELEVKRECVDQYKRLFMSGNTAAIIADVSARYNLHWLSQHPHKTLPQIIGRERGAPMAFVERFKRVIKQAYQSDREEFLEVLGVIE